MFNLRDRWYNIENRIIEESEGNHLDGGAWPTGCHDHTGCGCGMNGGGIGCDQPVKGRRGAQHIHFVVGHGRKPQASGGIGAAPKDGGISGPGPLGSGGALSFNGPSWNGAGPNGTDGGGNG